MRVRQTDVNGDWNFGKGKNNYLTDNAATAQNIKTRLGSFLGNCFFDLGAGIDWFNRLGSKARLALELDISSIILNTPDVTGIVSLSTSVDPGTRNFVATYTVQTVYSIITNTFTFSQNEVG